MTMQGDFSTGSAVDAAIFRALLDALFHNCPTNAAGLMEPNDYARKVWSELSAHTYRDGKQGCTDARTILEKRNLKIDADEQTAGENKP
jgi:hypothetical protein